MNFFKALFSTLFIFLTTFYNISAQNVGIGIEVPKAPLHILNGGTPGVMQYPYETFVVERNTDFKIGIFNSSTNLSGGAAVMFGYNNSVDPNLRYPGAELQYAPLSSNAYFLRLNFVRRSQAGIVNTQSSYLNSVIFADNGRVGINLTNGGIDYISPGANLHVNGTVRFQNLPTGTGNNLVMDASGNVYKSSTVSARPYISEDVDALKTKVAFLETEIEKLKSLLSKRK